MVEDRTVGKKSRMSASADATWAIRHWRFWAAPVGLPFDQMFQARTSKRELCQAEMLVGSASGTAAMLSVGERPGFSCQR